MLLTRETSAAPDATLGRSCCAGRSAVQLSVQQLAGVHDPGGVELGLQRAQRRDPPGADLAGIHGAWSRPTA